MCENTADSSLSFFKILELRPGNETFQALDSRKMAPKAAGKGQSDDRVATYHSLIVYQEPLQAYKQVGVALKKSGSLDFYYDWRLVETSVAVPGKKEYTAIDLDFANIHYKCL